VQVESHSQTPEKEWEEDRMVNVDFVKFARSVISGFSVLLPQQLMRCPSTQSPFPKFHTRKIEIVRSTFLLV
jgi:hypothetical protein